MLGATVQRNSSLSRTLPASCPHLFRQTCLRRTLSAFPSTSSTLSPMPSVEACIHCGLLRSHWLPIAAKGRRRPATLYILPTSDWCGLVDRECRRGYFGGEGG